MRHLLISLFILGSALLTLAACGEDQPLNGGNGNGTDPLLPTAPCDSARNPAAGVNGFVLAGSGFRSEVIVLASPVREIGFEFDPERYAITMMDTVTSRAGTPLFVTIDYRIPGDARGTYQWNQEAGTGASSFTLTIGGPTTATRTFRSETGRFTIDSVILGGNPVGSYCGILKEQNGAARVGIMSGRFSTGE